MFVTYIVIIALVAIYTIILQSMKHGYGEGDGWTKHGGVRIHKVGEDIDDNSVMW